MIFTKLNQRQGDPTQADDLESLRGLTIHLISHNHWDREWIFTAKYTNHGLPPFFDNLFNMLAAQPDYRFVLDGQTRLIEDYLSQLPEEEALEREKLLRHYAQAGRLLIGPAYLQPDWGLVSGEALVRNLMIGCRKAAQFGPVMNVGWMLDNFGQIAQAPQIYRGFGIDGVFVWRGVAMAPDALKSEFCWRAPDGSEVLAIFLVNSYRNGMALSLTRLIALERILSEAAALRPFAATPHVLLMNGYEQVPWPDDVLPIIEALNQVAGGRFRCVQSTPPEYVAAVRQAQPELPVLQGYLYSGRYMPILKGVFSSRSQLKLLNNDCQRELERWAEPFAALAWTIGIEYPTARLDKAWETLLLNHTHDDVCGCSVDPVVRDMEARFERVQQLAGDITEASLRVITNSIDTSHGENLLALVVFNPSPRERREVLSFRLDLPAGLDTFSLKDGRGQAVPYQIAGRAGHKVDLYLYAADLPFLGYRTYYLAPGVEAVGPHPAVTASAQTNSMENDDLKVTINADGSLNVTEKQTGHTYRNLGYFEDGGDAGDTYDYSYPPQDTLVSSLGQPARITLLQGGPLLAQFKIEITLDLPEGLTEDRQARRSQTRPYPIISYVELAAGSRRVEFKTVVQNVVKDHRLRLLFPTGLTAACCYAEEPFDVACWPIQDEAMPAELSEVRKLMTAGRYTAPVNTNPFQNFVDYTDGRRGLAVISRRVTEYEILPKKEGAVALTLLRSVGWLARYDLQTRIGDVGPHIFTPEAQCLGKHVFYYALHPHYGNWSEEKTHVQAMSHNLRPRVVQTSAQFGQLPDELAFVSLQSHEPANAFRITALKRAEAGDGIIIRFFNTLDQAVSGELKTWWGQATRVFKTNLNEEEPVELANENGNVAIQTRPKEIVTLKLKLTPHLLIDVKRSDLTRLLPPLPLNDALPPVDLPPVLTEAEVQAERDRVTALEESLLKTKADVFTLEDDIERTAAQDDLVKQLELQKLKTEVATLTRQANEARISALLNRRLYLTNQIERELAEIEANMAWSRTKKRAGEYLVHYYENLLRQQH
ncbi:MAG: glycoside hydrolase family 38 C-terminal domain-containing protein [Chloroflexota bacterium]